MKCADEDRVIFGSSEGDRAWLDYESNLFLKRFDTWPELSVTEVYSRALGHGLDSMAKSCERGFERFRADEHEPTAWSEGSN
jgi:hypothetical protein